MTDALFSIGGKGTQLFTHSLLQSKSTFVLKTCNLNYCNSYNALKTEFCAGSTCTTDLQSTNCYKHWIAKGRYNKNFQSSINLDSCRFPKNKMIAVPKGASAVSTECDATGCLFDSSKCASCMSGGKLGKTATGNLIETVKADMLLSNTQGECGDTDKYGKWLWETTYSGSTGYTTCVAKCQDDPLCIKVQWEITTSKCYGVGTSSGSKNGVTGRVQTILYEDDDGTHTSSTWQKTIRVQPNVKYSVAWQVLRNDLQDSDENVVDVKLDGTSFGGW